MAWVATSLAPRSMPAGSRLLLACELFIGLGLVALTIAAALAWRAHGGAPPFVSPFEFGVRWLALYGS